MARLKKLQFVLGELIRKHRENLGADTVTFYAHDPIWPDDLALVAWDGVRHPEPMHGLLRPADSRRIIESGEPEIFAPDCEVEPGLRRKVDNDPLYGGFVQREGLRSTARIVQREAQRVRTVLFVGYRNTVEFGEDLRAAVRRLDHDLTNHFDELQDALGKRPTPFLSRMVGKLREPFELVGQGSVNDYLQRVLIAAMETFGVTEDTGLGTLYSFDAYRNILTRRAACGLENDLLCTRDIRERNGIVSWVASRRCSIVISDLTTSAFQKYHLSALLKEGMRSQIAVPMLAGEELLGVVNLESADVGRFKPSAVRALWYASNQAAVALWMSNEIERRQELLQISREAVQPEHNAERTPLDRIADFARTSMSADRCDIWQTDEDVVRFEGVGFSYPSPSPRSTPRSNGWSSRVAKGSKPVWLENLAFADEQAPTFTAYEWSGDAWVPMDGDLAESISLNPSIREQKPSHELCLPLAIGKESIGVVWIKYLHSSVVRPTDRQMQVALSTASMVGLVLQSRLRMTRRIRRQLEAFKRDLLPDPTDGIPGVDIGLVSQPHHGSAIGGDFFGIHRLEGEPSRYGIVIGDGEGHGIDGAMHMLPAVTAFRMSFGDTCSPKYVLERIARFASEIDAFRATLGYYIIDIDSRTNSRTIVGATLGHPRLIIVRPETLQTKRLPELEQSTAGGAGYVRNGPLLEDYTRLEPGDLVIGFTDGIPEAGPSGGRFEERGILQVVHRQDWRSAQQLADAIYDSAAAHNGFALSDDATVFVLRIRKETDLDDEGDD